MSADPEVAELKRSVTLERVLAYYGADLNGKGVGRCLFPDRHHHGDQDPSMYVRNGRVYCRSQQCFGEKGADQFALVALMDGLLTFPDQKRKVMEIGGLSNGNGQHPRQILRRFQWSDAEGHVAWKLRWNTDEPGKKCTWAQDPGNHKSGLGDCLPILYGLDQVAIASEVILVEGERDADTVNEWLEAAAGIAPRRATCTPHGATDVKPEYLLPLHGKTTIWVSGDNDLAGGKYRTLCAEILHGQALDVRNLTVPEGVKDWTDWGEAGGTVEQFTALLDQAPTWNPADNSIRPYKSGSCDRSNSSGLFQPFDLGVLLAEPEEEIPWRVDSYLADGTLSLLAGPPKVGKSTLAYALAIAVALGRPWLGRSVRKTNVLVLALEEHRRDVIRRFWAADQEALGDQIKIFSGRLAFTEELLAEIVAYIQQHQIGLVLIDTLHAWWGLDDENSAGEVLKAGNLLLDAVRQTDAAWFCLAHTRKSGGEFGEEIRGSSALLGLVDVALSLKRTAAGDPQRCLTAVSRYAETPAKLIINLADHGYEALGSPEEVGLTAKIDKLRAALTGTGQTVKALMAATGLSKQDVSKCLPRLGEPIVKEGTGHKNAPFTYRRHSICRTPHSMGAPCDESNATREDIRSVLPPVPCDESNYGVDE